MEGVQTVNCQLFILGPHYAAYEQCSSRNLFVVFVANRREKGVNSFRLGSTNLPPL